MPSLSDKHPTIHLITRIRCNDQQPISFSYLAKMYFCMHNWERALERTGIQGYGIIILHRGTRLIVHNSCCIVKKYDRMFSNYSRRIKLSMNNPRIYTKFINFLAITSRHIACWMIVFTMGIWCNLAQAHNNLPELGSEFREIISVRDEALIGASWLWEIRAAGLMHDDPILHEYVQYIGNKLTPFMAVPYNNMRVKFFAINDKNVNAFAFFGGHIGVHAGLITMTQHESELAAVMAHELAHISQQHTLRQIAEDKRMMPVTLAETLAALALGHPELMLPIVAGHSQHMLNFSRKHEQEADRLGLQILANANFNPESLPIVLERMGSLTRYHSLPPEYLLTHPLHESRISDARNRAHEFKIVQTPNSFMYHLVKSRIEVQTAENLHHLLETYEHKMSTKRYANETAMQYAYAYALLRMDKPQKAWNTIKPLAEKYPTDIIIQLTAAEIEQANHQNTHAQKRIEQLLKIYPDSSSILLQYADLLVTNKQPRSASIVLNKYKKLHAPEANFYELVRQAEGMQNNQVAVYEANAEWYMLHGDLGSALKQLDTAIETAKAENKSIYKLDARKQEINALLTKIKKF